jgi:DnaJ-class molecular chaperone
MSIICSRCNGSGECNNEFHEPDSMAEAIWDQLLSECPDCGSNNTQMGGKCPECGGTGITL